MCGAESSDGHLDQMSGAESIDGHLDQMSGAESSDGHLDQSAQTVKKGTPFYLRQVRLRPGYKQTVMIHTRTKKAMNK